MRLETWSSWRRRALSLRDVPPTEGIFIGVIVVALLRKKLDVQQDGYAKFKGGKVSDSLELGGLVAGSVRTGEFSFAAYHRCVTFFIRVEICMACVLRGRYYVRSEARP
jgi:hypothetical protein